MTYAEYLKSQGASDEEVKILDTPLGRKSYDAMVAAQAEATKLRADSEKYQETVNTWYEEQKSKVAKTENELVAARANEARLTTVLRTAHERGMIDVAKDLGITFDAPPAKKDEPVPVDTSKFVTTDSLLTLAEKEADSIAWMNDIAAEHVYLTGQPLRNARELRAEATRRKVSIQQVWEEKYNIPKLRTDKEAAARQAAEEAIRKDERQKAEAEFASKYGNPDTRPLEPSRSFLIPRKDSGRDGTKQPWEVGADGEGGSNDRVKRALQNAAKTAVTH